MLFLYTFSIHLYGLGIRITSLFNPKARRWIRGRRGNFRRLEEALSHKGEWSGNVWFHCASLGEFEQGRPVMERFRELYPGYRIVLTFYSPSGFEVRKNFPGADNILYMPLDTPRNARRWIRLLKPKLVFFIKYEYWFNFLAELHRNHVPVFIISAIFHRDQPFFRWYGSWFRRRLHYISWFFLQGEEGVKLAEELGIKRFTLTGDTRFDRVWTIRELPVPFPLIEQFAAGHRIFLGGSTWEPDETLIAGLMKQDLPGMKFIIAPHEVGESRITSLVSRIRDPGSGIEVIPRSGVTKQRDPGSVIRYSELTPETAASARVLIIDSIGILAPLYRYASFALIGGGFGVGIHNILEAAVFGNPVFFGPNHGKFTEARELIRLGGAFVVNEASDLVQETTRMLNDPDEYHRISVVTRTYVEHGQGATRRILQGIQSLGFIAPALGTPA